MLNLTFTSFLRSLTVTYPEVYWNQRDPGRLQLSPGRTPTRVP